MVLTRLPIPVASSDLISIDHIKLQLLINDIFLDFPGQVLPDFFRSINGIEQESAAFYRVLKHIEPLQEGELVAGNELGVADQVWSPDRFGTKAQVRETVTVPDFLES